MANRRMEKVARVIRQSVSETIHQHLNDPRITGLISVTDVQVAPDMHNATVSLSIMAPDEDARQHTFKAIRHAAGVIQYYLGKALTSRFCPHLHFELDNKMQRTLETLKLIEQAAEEFGDNDKDDINSDTDGTLSGTDD